MQTNFFRRYYQSTFVSELGLWCLWTFYLSLHIYFQIFPVIHRNEHISLEPAPHAQDDNKCSDDWEEDNPTKNISGPRFVELGGGELKIKSRVFDWQAILFGRKRTVGELLELHWVIINFRVGDRVGGEYVGEEIYPVYSRLQGVCGTDPHACDD